MIGIVVVTWNSADVIGECLDGCLRMPGVEVIAVDNASSDRTAEVIRSRAGVRLIANRENRGFAAAVNQGFAELNTAAVLVLNPDAVPVDGINCLAEAVLQPGIGAAGGLLTDANGDPQDGFNVRAFPSPATLAFEVLGLNRLAPWNPVNRRYRSAVRQQADVDQPAGAFLMVNRAAWRAVGGLDESFYPAWFEDVDFCLRLRKCGYRVRYIPEARATHVGGHSVNYLSWNDRQVFWYGNLLRYSRKHFGRAGRRIVAGALMSACIPRAVVRGELAGAGVYSKVFRMAWESWHEPAPSQSLSSELIVTEGEERPL